VTDLDLDRPVTGLDQAAPLGGRFLRAAQPDGEVRQDRTRGAAEERSQRHAGRPRQEVVHSHVQGGPSGGVAADASVHGPVQVLDGPGIQALDGGPQELTDGRLAALNGLSGQEGLGDRLSDTRQSVAGVDADHQGPAHVRNHGRGTERLVAAQSCAQDLNPEELHGDLRRALKGSRGSRFFPARAPPAREAGRSSQPACERALPPHARTCVLSMRERAFPDGIGIFFSCEGGGACYTPPVPAACARSQAEAGPWPAEEISPLVLASSSPRRRDLLQQVGLVFQVMVPDASAEVGIRAGRNLGQTLSHVEAAARAKALSVAQRLPGGTLVIGADTVVLLGRRLLGKPRNPGEAISMLRALSGRVHRVVTAVAVLRAGQGPGQVAHEQTRVRFRALNDEEIAGYVSSGEPLDKAGAYGIQGLGALLVERVEGCYFNVVGMPLTLLHGMLRSFGWDLLGPRGD